MTTPSPTTRDVGAVYAQTRQLDGTEQRTRLVVQSETPRERWLDALLTCGILAALLYIAMTLLVGRRWTGYSAASQMISELSAIEAPTRGLWIVLGSVYTVLMIAFGIGVWRSASRRAQRVLGILLVTHAGFGSYWPPMHQRAVLASGGATLTDTLHIVWAIGTGLLFMLEAGFGAAVFGQRFRLYSIATIVIALICGAVTGTYASQVQANVPTPGAGVWERFSAASYMLWIAVLAIALLRARVHPADETGA